ncbi:hypothetical protein [Sulfoacidibacillus ferrooxidans]|uniref:Uncharacterized protein n=1 Tax=Sulfoacidibacillus ferrooxidans TaxID=2005001 RepID=A0A9X1V928_9BACL|nr:hypothetical protein [Sulfoacidibacillus ferrooxidans]MCI0183422.1 hypothetical protein [Sulfoacidibacillus ferrooxidans]
MNFTTESYSQLDPDEKRIALNYLDIASGELCELLNLSNFDVLHTIVVGDIGVEKAFRVASKGYYETVVHFSVESPMDRSISSSVVMIMSSFFIGMLYGNYNKENYFVCADAFL